jgi:hypothetical protein
MESAGVGAFRLALASVFAGSHVLTLIHTSEALCELWQTTATSKNKE